MCKRMDSLCETLAISAAETGMGKLQLSRRRRFCFSPVLALGCQYKHVHSELTFVQATMCA